MRANYKQRAEECYDHSKDARSTAEKAVWMAIAENWTVLAQDEGEENLQNIASQIFGFGENNQAKLNSKLSVPEAPSCDAAKARKADQNGFARMIELAGARASGTHRT
jgi:hypothetical protein